MAVLPASTSCIISISVDVFTVVWTSVSLFWLQNNSNNFCNHIFLYAVKTGNKQNEQSICKLLLFYPVDNSRIIDCVWHCLALHHFKNKRTPGADRKRHGSQPGKKRLLDTGGYHSRRRSIWISGWRSDTRQIRSAGGYILCRCRA